MSKLRWKRCLARLNLSVQKCATFRRLSYLLLLLFKCPSNLQLVFHENVNVPIKITLMLKQKYKTLFFISAEILTILGLI